LQHDLGLEFRAKLSSASHGVTSLSWTMILLLASCPISGGHFNLPK
jgi:hypothetical protein